MPKPFDSEELAARLRVAERILGLRAEVQTLHSPLSIFMYCRRIRDAGDQWVDLERYVARHTNTAVSHGICPDCLALKRPEFGRFRPLL